ncbi:nitrogen regulation protein NR(I) [Inmirania thermothiophila]|uniref:DNA-binding transcriptional regulator NtrC n=1 Tax=Inmirania thermothiophila TaxID=1750597 RepID=A0A3N1Y5V8_9GAMM|nr:nitrogen regulation protein NR(I) [Inmirania thermothiophila]ROR34193.1 two-component system nitrogen regulation response regulator GlnG [Inmirania thermothiophila]
MAEPHAIGRPRVWVVDDDRSIRWVLERALGGAGFAVRCFADGDAALAALRAEGAPEALVSDIRMPGLDGLALLEAVRAEDPDLPVIVITAHSDLDSAVSAYRGGAFEYLAKPFDVDEAVALVRRALRQRASAPAEAPPPAAAPEIIGEDPAMQEVFRAIGRLARSHATVLIVGESGTGKELVAHALHRHGPRAGGPFIALNMAAIPRDLLESELFGHEKGAFTGAASRRPGRFEQAHGGTLFLDEIGDMPAELQTRLLRVLATGEFFPVGGRDPVRVDVRVIAATHQDLEARVREGLFREDLYHRLNVIRIRVPPLRERRSDIPRLARHFLRRAAAEMGVEPKRLSDEAAAVLGSLPWPGNVRQLENTCRWLTVMASGREIQAEDLPPELCADAAPAPEAAEDWEAALRRWAAARLAAGAADLLAEAGPRFERALAETALAHTGGLRQEAARLVGWGRNTLTRKLRELGIEPGEERRQPAPRRAGQYSSR